MRSPLIPTMLLVVLGTLGLYAYVFIKPALFIAILTAAACLFVRFALTPESRMQLRDTPLIVGVALPLVAWSITNIWLLYLAMALVVPLAAHRRETVAPLYLFSLLLLPGLDTVILLGSLKLFDCGVHDMLGLGAVARLLLYPRRDPLPFRYEAPVAGLILLIVCATARDTSITNFLRVLINTSLDCAMPYYIISRSVRSVADVKLCMLYLINAAAILALILLYEARASWPIYNALYPAHGLNTLLLVKLRGGTLRSGGPFVEPTSVAMVLAWCILAAWLSRSAFRSRALHTGVLALLLAGLVAPQSRGAWIGLILSTVVADLYRSHIAAAARRVALVGAVAASLMAIAPASPYLSDTLGMSEGSASTVDYRARLFSRGMEEYWKSPIVGYSPPEVLIHLADLEQGEGIIDFVNTYIFFALVSGIVGLAIFVGTFTVYVHGLWARRGAVLRDDASSAAATFVFAALVMPMEMLSFTSLGGRVEAMLFVLFGFAATLMAAHARVTARPLLAPAFDYAPASRESV